MSVRIYFMKSKKVCKDVSIMSPQHDSVDGQVYSVYVL